MENLAKSHLEVILWLVCRMLRVYFENTKYQKQLREKEDYIFWDSNKVQYQAFENQGFQLSKSSKYVKYFQKKFKLYKEFLYKIFETKLKLKYQLQYKQ